MDRRFDTEVHKEYHDNGGMFKSVLKVTYNKDAEKPYFAFADDGWGGGYGNSYRTLEEAKINLPRLFNKVFGYDN